MFYEEARNGMFVITLFEARGLRNVDPLGHQRPYVNVSYGKLNSKRTKFVEGSPTEPYFSEEAVCLAADPGNWMEDAVIDILDQDIGASKPIGSVKKNLLPYMNYSLPLKEGVPETLNAGGNSEVVVKVCQA